jgi:redox-sensitive bicupin YhaK (pirin superfamily)
MANNKKVKGVFESGSTHWVGDGFHVRNLFPSNGLENEVSPFLMLDYAGPTVFPPADKPRGVGEHPHRGFETVTIVYQGSLQHRDSGGNAGTIGPGDVQWMTAGSGVVHEEKQTPQFAKDGGTMEMVQLWVNLPKARKMTDPRYQTLTASQIPTVDLGGEGGYARVIAGELHGAQGPASTFTPVHVYDVRLKSGQSAELALPAGFHSTVVLLKGSLQVNGSDLLDGEAKLAVLDTEGDRVSLEARQDTTALVLSGEPIREPVASYGPFVMNTREELVQAVEDYRAGRMGRIAG